MAIKCLQLTSVWHLNTFFGKTIKALAVAAYILLVAFAINYSLLYSTYAQMAIGALGVFVILFVCEWISCLFFDHTHLQQNGFKSAACQLITKVSYASMCSYMFHRLFFWAAEKLWNPSDTSIKWLFMIVVIYPIILVSSYTIQKLYDNMVKRL